MMMMMMMMIAFLLLASIALTWACEETQNIAQYTHDETFSNAKFAAPNRFTVRGNGLCGQKCRNGPRRWYTRGYGNNFIVSWTEVPETDTWGAEGHISTYSFTEQNGFALVSDFKFPECINMGGIATNDDGSVIGVLCQTRSTTTINGAIDLVGTRYNANKCENDTKFQNLDNQFNGTCGAGIYNCYPIGWMNDRSCGDRRNYKFFLYEWTGGQVTQTPDTVVFINGAGGGWNYGHWEVSLNKDDSLYYVDLKVTANSHEGETHFGISRTDYTYVGGMTDGWASGPGHTELNRVTYNKAIDQWSVIAGLDWCSEGGSCNSMYWRTVPEGTDNPKNAELLMYKPKGNTYNRNGFPMHSISLGLDGWMAVAIGGNPISDTMADHRIGTIKLPVNISQYNLNPSQYKLNWLTTPPPSDPDAAPRVGMANLMNFGTGGEDSGRILMGWSPAMKTQGIASEYVVAEVDKSNGYIIGKPMTVNQTGWGEDNVWGYLPGSGCVVFAFAWKGDNGPGDSYGIIGRDYTEYNNVMRLTALCPTASAPCNGVGTAPQEDSSLDNAAPSLHIGVFLTVLGFMLCSLF